MSNTSLVHSTSEATVHSTSEATMSTQNAYDVSTIVYTSNSEPNQYSDTQYWSSTTMNAFNIFQLNVSCIVLVYIILKVCMHNVCIMSNYI